MSMQSLKNSFENSFQLLAHRGYAARYPENTREAISAAVAAGASLVEFDVQLTRDRVPILLHDADFARTGGNPASVLDLDYAEVESITVEEADKFGDAFAGIRAPRLAEVVVDLAGWEQVTAFVELKRHSLKRFGVDAVLDVVLPILAPVIDQSVLISFNAEVLYAAKQRLPIRTGWALRRYDKASRRLAEDLLPDYLFCNQTRLPSGSGALWQGSWDWVVYEIVEPQAARKLAARGVAVIETKDYAGMALALKD